MTKKDFIIIADTIFAFIDNPTMREKLTANDKEFLIDLFSERLRSQNYHFNRQRFGRNFRRKTYFKTAGDLGFRSGDARTQIKNN